MRRSVWAHRLAGTRPGSTNRVGIDKNNLNIQLKINLNFIGEFGESSELIKRNAPRDHSASHMTESRESRPCLKGSRLLIQELLKFRIFFKKIRIALLA